ncbi:hypothetical protein Tco_0370959 [Tanacetum coccineum]
MQGKSVETQFDKPSVVRQPNAQRIPKPSVLGKPTPFSNSPEMRSSNDMVHNYYLEKAKKSAQLQKDKDVNGKPSMIDPARLPNTANGCKPKAKELDTMLSMSSRCLYSANHDECVLEYLSRLNPRTSAQNKDAKSHKTTKRYMPVEKSSASKKPERQIPTGHRFSNKKTTTVPEKTMNPRSCLRWQLTGRILKTVGLRWKPTGRVFKNVVLRWVPTGKTFASSTTKVDSEPPNGSNADITNQCESEQALDVSAGTLLSTADQASVFMAMTSVHISSGLVLHQMTSDHNRSELGIQDHSNEQSSSKLVPKVVPLAVKTTTSRQELELLFHHHIAMLRTTGKRQDPRFKEAVRRRFDLVNGELSIIIIFISRRFAILMASCLLGGELSRWQSDQASEY